MKVFNKIYIIMVLLILAILIIIPKEENLNDKEFQNIHVTVSNDGSMRVSEFITFEKRLTSSNMFKEELASELNARNIKVYGKNIFGLHKLTHNLSYSSSKNEVITFKKSPLYSAYLINYDTDNIIQKYDKGLGILYPITVNSDLWTNNLRVVFEFYKKLNTENKDKVITEVYPLAMSDKRMKISGNKIVIDSTNYPSKNNASIVIKFDKEQVLSDYADNLSKDNKEIILPKDKLLEKQREQLDLLKEKKKERSYDLTIVRKYVSYSIITVLFMLYIVYVYLIYRGIRMRHFKIRKVKENSDIPFNKDLIKAYIYMDKDAEKNYDNVVSLISSMIIKLETLDYIVLKEDGVKILEKSQSQLRVLLPTERELLNNIYEADSDNVNFVTYDKVTQKLKENSSKILLSIDEEKDLKSNDLEKEGVVIKPMQRVDFKIILFQIPILTLLVLYGYTNILIALIVFITLYIVMYVASSVNDGGYTKKGIKNKKSLKGFEKNLKSKIKQETLNKNDKIYAELFGLKSHEKAHVLSKAAASYIKLIESIKSNGSHDDKQDKL